MYIQHIICREHYTNATKVAAGKDKANFNHIKLLILLSGM